MMSIKINTIDGQHIKIIHIHPLILEYMNLLLVTNLFGSFFHLPIMSSVIIKCYRPIYIINVPSFLFWWCIHMLALAVESKVGSDREQQTIVQRRQPDDYGLVLMPAVVIMIWAIFSMWNKNFAFRYRNFVPGFKFQYKF